MGPYDKKRLELLDALNRKDEINQRELSKTLKVSLGSVNASLKDLITERLIMKKSSSARRILYNLTPEGVSEKNRLSRLFWQQSVERYTQLRHMIACVLNKLEEEDVKNVAFYGAGHVAEIAYIALLHTDLQLTGIFDEEKKGEKFLTFRVIPPTEIESIPFNKILITDLNINKHLNNEDIFLKRWAQSLVFINL